VRSTMPSKHQPGRWSAVFRLSGILDAVFAREDVSIEGVIFPPLLILFVVLGDQSRAV